MGGKWSIGESNRTYKRNIQWYGGQYRQSAGNITGPVLSNNFLHPPRMYKVSCLLYWNVYALLFSLIVHIPPNYYTPYCLSLSKLISVVVCVVKSGLLGWLIGLVKSVLQFTVCIIANLTT